MSRYDELLDQDEGAAPASRYDALLGEEPDRLRANAQVTADADPDKVAAALRKMRGAGTAEGLALTNPEEVLKAAEGAEARSRYDQILERAPTLATWLENPANMAVAKDDVDNLSQLGQVWRVTKAGGQELAAGLTDVSGIYYGAAAPFEVAGGKTITGQVWAHFLRQMGDLAKVLPGRIAPDEPAEGTVEAGFRSGMRSVGQTIPLLAGTVATGNPAVMLGGMAAQTGGAEYGRAREAGLTPAQSASYGVTQGAFEYLTERIPAVKFLEDLKIGSTVGKTLVNLIAREVPSEQVATLLQDLNEWAYLNPEKTIGEYAAERPEAAAQTLVATLVAAGLQTGAGKGLQMLGERADRAGEAKDRLEQMDRLADASKLRERSPEKFEEVAEAHLRESGRETVYLPVEQFETFYQSQPGGADAAWQRLTGTPDGFRQARAAGADLQIPYAKYLGRLTPEERKALTPHLRLSPDEMSAVERDAFDKDRESIVGDAMKAAGEVEQDAAYEVIYQDLLGQLLGRFPRDVADKYAAAEAARFVTFNRIVGRDPVEDYRANGPTIVSEVPEALRRIDFDVELDPMIERLRAGNVPSERDARGQTLLEFLREKGGIQDEGGELKVLDAEKADRALRRGGERRLVNPEGMTLDAAREAAVEAGYLREADFNEEAVSDVNGLLEAIERELRGTAVYAQGREAPGAEDARRALNELGQYLDQSGIDLATTSNEQIKAFLKGGAAPAAMQQQDQTVLEQPRVGLQVYSDGTLKILSQDYARRAKAAENDQERERWVGHQEAMDAEIAARARGESAYRGRGALQTLFQPAYHGSPHDIGPEGFRTDKIGTGEGAQVYGWGLYFAENQAVARDYQRRLSDASAHQKFFIDGKQIDPISPEKHAASLLYYNDAREIRAATKRWLKEYPTSKGMQETAEKAGLSPEEYWARLNDFVQNRKRKEITVEKGRLYQVDIPDEAVARMLDWDKPLSAQPESVRKALDEHFAADKDMQYWNAVKAFEAGDQQAMKKAGFNIFAYSGAAGQIYEHIAEVHGQQRASQLLNKRGIPGIRYLDQGSRDTGDGTRNLVVFDDKLVTITHKDGSPVTAEERKDVLEQAAADGSGASAARGQIRFTKRGSGNRVFEITLKGADLSTFLHEMGHYWLERMVDVALAGGPQQVQDDVNTLLQKYGGIAVAEWEGLTDEKRTAIHESIARANEAYLMEGKAPSARLRQAFARFRSWLLQVYERMARLNIDLSPEVRGVFDRLYASSQEIDEARTAQRLKPLWLSAEEAGMTEAEWAAYIGGFDAARVQAEEELAVEMLEPIRREEKDWWKAKRKAVTAEVTAAVDRRKDIVALSVLRTGKMPDGTEVDTPKLSKEALVEDFGFTPESLAKLPRGIYSASGGASADALAPVFGYNTGRELIEALAVVPNRQALIRESVESELRRRYPDIVDDGSVGEKAMRAVHNDKAGELLVREAQILADRAGAQSTGRDAGLRRWRLSQQMAKAAAQRVIDGTALRDIKPARWRAAAAKQGELAYKLARAGKLAEAAQAKQRQVMNHFLFREATRAFEASEKRLKDLHALSTKEKRERIGKAGGMEYAARYRDGTEEVFGSRKAAEEAVAEKGGFWFATNTYLEQIDRILERYDLRVRTNRKLASRESLRQFADRLTAEGIPHDIPEEVIADAREVNFSELPYGFFTAVADAVDTIENVAVRKAELVIAGQKRDRDEAATEIQNSIKANVKDRLPGIAERDLGERIEDAGNEALSVYLNANYMTRELDGGEAGKVNELLYRPVVDAAVHAENRKGVVQQQLAEIYARHYSPKEMRAMASRRGANAVPMREIGETWTKWDVVSVAMNWGNEGNREAVLRGQYAGGRRLTQASIDRLLGLNGQPGLMTEKDWAFVQDVWKYVDSFWPEIRAKQQQRTGTAPEKVTGAPILTAFGQIEGGYYPLQYDGAQGGKAGMDAQDDIFEALRTGRYGRAQTKRGHTEARVGSGGRPVTIGMHVLTRHLQNVVYDLEMGDAVSSVYRLLDHRGVQQAFTEAGKRSYHRQLMLWLKDTATGEMQAANWFEGLLRGMRINFTKAVLTFKVASAALQITGIAQSAALLGPKYAWRGMQQVLTRNPFGQRGWYQQIIAASPAMKARWERGGYNAAVADVLNAAQGGVVPSWVYAAGYFMMSRVQMITDAVSWTAAYAKAVDAGKTAKQATVEADDLVNRAQGSGLFVDRSALERGTISETVRQTEMVRMFTTLMSYMMAKGRMAYELTRKTSFKDPVQVGRYTVQMAMIFTVEALLVAMIRGQLGDDDDDDSILDDLAKTAAKQSVLSLVGTVPLLTYLGSEIQGFRGGPSINETWERAGKLTTQVEQGELDKALATAASDAAGILVGFPSAQTNIALDAFWRAQEGEDVSPLEYLVRTNKPG